MTEDQRGEARTRAKSRETREEREARRAAAQRVNRWLIIGTAVLVVALILRAVSSSMILDERASLELPAPSNESVPLNDALQGRGLPLSDLHEDLDGANLDAPWVHVALYSNGRWEGEAWGTGRGLQEAISDAYVSAKKASASRATHAVISVATDRTKLNPRSTRGAFSNVHRGIRGVFVEHPEAPFRLSPTATIASNRPIEDELEAQARKRKMKLATWLRESELYSVATRQFYVSLEPGGKSREILRGNDVIRPAEVTQERVQEFERLLTDWMFNNLDHSSGRLTYIYYPSKGEETRANNMIRQWMGSVAMGRAARLHPERNAVPLSTRNLQYNLEHFYEQEGDLGYIEYRGQAKLGAAALAMIGLMESPARETFQKEEQSLFNMTRHLWQPSGRFMTFYKPKSRNDENHNFYPGETLLAWAFRYQREPDPALLDQAMKSYAHYKQWHLDNRNPAFIPWHTQAYYLFYQQTQNEELRHWVFEMNDWLIDTMQAHSRVAYDDTLGRFYSPHEPYGVPHASSTGVYLEGLIDAFALARDTGDDAHREKYRKAIILGLRSSMQLQFQDEVDMFYASNRKRLRGGMRTTVYDNEIRVDNVQHVLMGVQKILKEFEASDYVLPD